VVGRGLGSSGYYVGRHCEDRSFKNLKTSPGLVDCTLDFLADSVFESCGLVSFFELGAPFAQSRGICYHKYCIGCVCAFNLFEGLPLRRVI
jgi:hypothetical protein